MDWTNVSHLAQAGLVCIGMVMFALGYSARDKL